jgi:uncharacterized protein DUF4154
MKKSLLLVMFLSFALLSFKSEQDYKFQRTFIYNFTKYIQWPPSQQTGNFIIGVLGDSPITAELELLANSRSAGAQKFEIKKLNSISEISHLHMLFVPKSKNGQIKSILKKVNGKSTLVITEGKGMAVKGGGINFIYVNGKPRFEINKKATDKSNLKVSSELMKLAIMI